MLSQRYIFSLLKILAEENCWLENTQAKKDTFNRSIFDEFEASK